MQVQLVEKYEQHSTELDREVIASNIRAWRNRQVSGLGLALGWGMGIGIRD